VGGLAIARRLLQHLLPGVERLPPVAELLLPDGRDLLHEPHAIRRVARAAQVALERDEELLVLARAPERGAQPLARLGVAAGHRGEARPHLGGRLVLAELVEE